MKAKIYIKYKEGILDPQGKTVEKNTSKLGIENISNIRIGKHIFLEVESENLEKAKETIKEICEKLLVNQITEQYDFEIIKI